MNRYIIAKELLKVAELLIGGTSEKEVERLLKVLLPTTEWKGLAFSVGGYNRDEILGISSKDLDVVVEQKDGAKKLTHYISDLFYPAVTKPHQMGAGYPIWQITFKENVTYKNEVYETEGAVIEFADTMKESFPDESSRQRETEFGTLRDDVDRRDFSVNSLLKDLTTGEFLDLTGHSIADIKQGILRGNAGVDLDKIFREDSLRMLRLIRFQTKYDWSIPLSVLKTVKRNAQRIEIVSSERIMGELTKIMKLGKLAQAIRLMKATGLLQYILPEISAMQGVKQPKEYHMEGDVFSHVIQVLKNAPPTIEGQMAALLHDVGKPSTQTIIGDKIQFLGHEDVGADIAEVIMRRLKFDLDTIKKVRLMVENHMRPHSLTDASEKSLRKFIRDVGDEMVDAIVALARADELGSVPNENLIPILQERLKKIKEAPVKIVKKPVLDGLEIMELLQIKAGPKIGEIGKYLLEMQDEFASEGKELDKDTAKNLVLEKFKN